ncbi:SDR family NAD(P)-dependent oxidoreductase [Xanthomonas phaseoli]|uniref:3-oxoacyl-ACP reductase n=1 Tax=Xanthomonas phaseoli pv. dieffenbachiae TaxID=92828 RepID=A0A1V9HCS5_9XANT|nr:SDR family oxidoreductase [Xanthomonas phaseoli]MBO9789942.1 SDR family oxidoreductase [Xanthomonas phaseoli pv. dieffenbachiae]MBO9832742.1 SDR family oxidoreductase [Xanthomonas phaseoli pv. dieffenbachiae]MBO9835382.1 SDR family oxidoreductase [Xanthomonas phaseoli pv. dieffenbachiae]MBO9842560.1 SDR family oxidoreductase [Xanthomonas phaseoli pv. dieffenbachiae]MBO9853886.1 SDR family oxidoreductase [Xanthomonas phaseoli pv. dieffenbachiae]
MGVIVITGGSRGIGAGTALECAKRGMGVILTYQSQAEAAAAVVEEIKAKGGRAVALGLDVGDVATFGEFKDAVARQLEDGWQVKKLSGLVNNAGHGLFNAIETVTEQQFDALCDVHLKGPFFLTQALLPLFERGASIVNLTSATTRSATAGVAPYAACKGGLEVLTRYMAKEFGERGIRINAVSPGAIRTELGGGMDEAFEAVLSSQTALGRIGEPEDVAHVIAMLLSQDGQWINGQSIDVSGGYNL